jgi:hypothetical protein
VRKLPVGSRLPLAAAALLLAAPLTARPAASADASDRWIFPVPARRIALARATGRSGELRAGRELERDDPLRAAIAAELDAPFYRSMIRLAQAARNLAGDTDGPNVLYLSQDEGGFARQGLALTDADGEHRYPGLNYVDLVVDPARLEGGELDVFAHELGHAMMNTLWPRLGVGAESRLSPKMHLSMGVTDSYTALFEGFGIHFERLTHDRIADYRQQFAAKLRRPDNASTWWHSTIDGELRQNAVLQNRYIFERQLPLGIDLAALSPEERLLLAHATPIFDPTRLRNAQQMLASEGVVATILERIAASEPLATSWREAEFYRPFLASEPPELRPEELFTSFENLYLKHFWVWRTLDAADDEGARPLLVRYLETWIAAFPADRETLLGIALGTTVGTTCDPELGRRFLAVTRAGVLGDYAGYRQARVAYEERFAQILRRLVDGSLALDAEVGPELWIEVPGVTIRHALWSPEPRSPLRINLNTADALELAALPGVDATRAADLLARRAERRYFRSLDELRELGVELPERGETGSHAPRP